MNRHPQEESDHASGKAAESTFDAPPRRAAFVAWICGLAGWIGCVAIVVALDFLGGDYRAPNRRYAATAAAVGIFLFFVHSFSPRMSLRGFLRSSVKAVFTTFGIAVFVAWVDLAARRIEATGYASTLFAECGYRFLGMFGYEAGRESATLMVRHQDGLVAILCTGEKIALRPFIGLTVASVLFAAVNGVRRNALLVLPLSVAAVAMVRFLALVALYLDHERILAKAIPSHLDLFVDPWITTAALSAVALIVGGVGAMSRGEIDVRRERSPMSRRIAVATVLCTFLGSFGALLDDCGVRKSGRILIDDRTCRYWEPSARLLDENWYGDFSTYNFNSAAEWLGQHYIVNVNMSRRYDDGILDDVDVFILKTPISEISSSEITAIRRYVERGGGLLLVGDHTNLLGMCTRLNEILEPYPLRFRNDGISRSDGRGFSEYSGPTIGRHPAAVSVDNFQFMTSCSLEYSWPATPVMLVPLCASEAADYANPSNFGRQIDDPGINRGPMALAASIAVGRGRIVAFTDSTVWSSFDLFKNGHEDLLFGCVEYCNRIESGARRWITSVAVVAILLAAILMAVERKREGRLSVAQIAAAAVAVIAGTFAAEFANRAAYRPPTPIIDPILVRVLWDGGECALPPVLGVTAPHPEVTFDTFFIVMQRIGARPDIAWKTETALDGEPDALIVINPLRTPSAEVFERMRRFVDKGGRLIVMDRARNALGSSAPRYLEEFGRRLTYRVGEVTNVDIEGMRRLELPRSDDIVTVADYGQGKIAFWLDSERWSREGIGHAFSVPWASARASYQTAFHVLGDVLGLRRHDRRSYGVIE